MLSSRGYTDLSDWITIYTARKRASTPRILSMKKTTKHQVPKQIHKTHFKTEHSYVKNWKPPPVLPVHKKSFLNSCRLASNTAIIKKQHDLRARGAGRIKSPKKITTETVILHLGFKNFSQMGGGVGGWRVETQNNNNNKKGKKKFQDILSTWVKI